VREARPLNDCSGATRVHDIVRKLLAVFPVAASLNAPPVLAEVIDDIAIEQLEAGTRVRLRLTGPVGYIRDYASADGKTVNVYLQTLAPENFSGAPPADEVKQSPRSSPAPRFTVRVSLDPRCDAAPNPVCVVIRFERAVRSRIRLGEDRRSLLLDLESKGERDSPTAREKP
jgi:hypothetical protein